MILVSHFAEGMSFFEFEPSLQSTKYDYWLKFIQQNKYSLFYEATFCVMNSKNTWNKKKQTEWNDIGNSILYIRKFSNKLAKN